MKFHLFFNWQNQWNWVGNFFKFCCNNRNNSITWRHFRVWTDKIHRLYQMQGKRNNCAQQLAGQEIPLSGALWPEPLTSEDVFKDLRMCEFTPEQATACTHARTPLPRPRIRATHGNYFLSPGSHILTLLCSARSHRFQQEFHQTSRPAHTSHGRRWTTLTPPGHRAQQHPSAGALAGARAAMAHTPAALSPVPPLSKGLQAQALTRQGGAGGCHDHPLCMPISQTLANHGAKAPTTLPPTLLAYRSRLVTKPRGLLIQKSRGGSSKGHSNAPN